MGWGREEGWGGWGEFLRMWEEFFCFLMGGLGRVEGRGRGFFIIIIVKYFGVVLICGCMFR